MTNYLRARLSDGRSWLGLTLLACLFGLGLIGVDAAAQEPVLPQTAPDAEIGLALFAERCANCHGPAGGGDGELAANLPQSPAALNDPALRQTAVPAALFGRVTDGIIDSGMPPFGPASSDPISEANRWDLIAAVYSFSTPADSIAQGEALYADNCLACHGETGGGDGPEAAADADLDLTRLSYWFNRSNEAVLDALSGDLIPGHDLALDPVELEAVVDYARTFSYAYVNPLAPQEPIEGATVSGLIVNGTTDEPVTEGEVELRAFTTEFQETLSITTTVDVDGRYQFDLPPIQPDWVFLAAVRTNGLSFSSNAGQVDRAHPALDLPITTYDTTTDPAVIRLEQIHLIFGFQGDVVQVSELYVISNEGTAVFVGESGDPRQGTIQFSLPQGAENPIFERTLGSFDSSIPATEIIQTDGGWADTVPLQPGQGGSNLIVSYNLPYQDGMILRRALPYAANSANVIMPDVGVTLAGGGWEFQGAREMSGGGGSFLSYARLNLPAGDELAMTLDGRPQAGTSGSAGAIAPRNSANELIVGGGVLLATLVGAGLAYRQWRSQPGAAVKHSHDEGDAADDEITRLLRAIADLDDAHERGQISPTDHASRRERLKAELKSLWH